MLKRKPASGVTPEAGLVLQLRYWVRTDSLVGAIVIARRRRRGISVGRVSAAIECGPLRWRRSVGRESHGLAIADRGHRDGAVEMEIHQGLGRNPDARTRAGR